jgi:hypothetical protein
MKKLEGSEGSINRSNRSYEDIARIDSTQNEGKFTFKPILLPPAIEVDE